MLEIAKENLVKSDLELYEIGKRLFEASLAKEEGPVREGLAAFRTLPKPTSIESFYKSAGERIAF